LACAEPPEGATSYDAILVVSFGGPERPEDVLPFLANVTRGRNVPRERLLAVAEHYRHIGGASPINSQVRALLGALRHELDQHGISLPLYWGNRNWHPMLRDTLRHMSARGVKRALAVVLAAYSSYSSCRQYLEDIARARADVGRIANRPQEAAESGPARAASSPSAPQVDKVRVFYNHPEFIAANAERIREVQRGLAPARSASRRLVFTAHSVPAAMAQNCEYERQLNETCHLVAGELGMPPELWSLAYQSRSGPPREPWLGPDILDHLVELKLHGAEQVLIHPIGFLSDHVEVLYDLDVEARARCEQLGLEMLRSHTVGTHPAFVGLLRELIAERVGAGGDIARRAVGQFGPGHDSCPEACCLPALRATRAGSC
jgi:ferrochelatase